MFNYYRNPRTTREIKHAEAHALEGIRVRARRNHKNLPDSYDDLCIRRWRMMTSWKDGTRRRRVWECGKLKHRDAVADHVAFHDDYERHLAAIGFEPRQKWVWRKRGLERMAILRSRLGWE